MTACPVKSLPLTVFTPRSFMCSAVRSAVWFSSIILIIVSRCSNWVGRGLSFVCSTSPYSTLYFSYPKMSGPR